MTSAWQFQFVCAKNYWLNLRILLRNGRARSLTPSSPMAGWERMLQVKDTLRSTVQVTFDGRVIKTYHGPDAQTRFENEVRVLRYLERKGCNFVPRVLEADPKKPRIVTSHCGTRVEHLDKARSRELFDELESYGVRHDDPDMRNVTYRHADGRFCIVDFELATILPRPN
jgi:hypothetical protein